MCNNCIHKAVCSIYRATGGVKKCEHHREERRGRWKHKGAWHIECSKCQYILAHIGEAKKYCPNCGAEMDGAEDGK